MEQSVSQQSASRCHRPRITLAGLQTKEKITSFWSKWSEQDHRKEETIPKVDVGHVIARWKILLLSLPLLILLLSTCVTATRLQTKVTTPSFEVRATKSEGETTQFPMKGSEDDRGKCHSCVALTLSVFSLCSLLSSLSLLLLCLLRLLLF